MDRCNQNVLVLKTHRQPQREGLRTVPRGSRCVFRKIVDGKVVVMIVVYVDVILPVSKTRENEERTLSYLGPSFKNKDLGEAEYHLDIMSRGTGRQEY